MSWSVRCVLVIIVLLHAVSQAQLNIVWAPCPRTLQWGDYDIPTAMQVSPNVSDCGTTTVNYLNDDPTSPLLDITIKKFKSASPKGTVVVLGDHIVVR
jgi:hypothetical protein